jgi:hypothetical protein
MDNMLCGNTKFYKDSQNNAFIELNGNDTCLTIGTTYGGLKFDPGYAGTSKKYIDITGYKYTSGGGAVSIKLTAHNL